MLCVSAVCVKADAKKDSDSGAAANAVAAKSIAEYLAPRDDKAIAAVCLSLMRDGSIVSVTVADAGGNLVYTEHKERETAGREISFPLENHGVKGKLTICYTDDPFDREKFERGVNDFRYTLYPYMREIDSRSFDLSDPKYETLRTEIVKFMKENGSGIKRYQSMFLWSNAGSPDLSGYAAEEFEPQGEMTDVYTRSPDMIAFAAINPYSMINFTVTMYLVRSYSTDDMGKHVIRSQLAFPRVITRRDKGTRWNIWVDEYEKIYLLDYDTDTGIAIMKGIYSRKR